MSNFCYWTGQNYDSNDQLVRDRHPKATETRKFPCISRSDHCVSVGAWTEENERISTVYQRKRLQQGTGTSGSESSLDMLIRHIHSVCLLLS